MTAIHGNRGQLLLALPPNAAFTNQALVDSGDHLTYNISNAPTKRYWDRTASFVFQQSSNGTTWNTVTPSSIQYVGGVVVFPSAVGGTNQARISSGAYLPYTAIGDILEWAPDISRSTHETTCMTTNSTPTRWRTYLPGLVGGTIKISKFLVDNTYLNLLTIFTDDTLVLSLVLDATNGYPRFESFGRLSKDGMKVSLKDLEMEDLDFQIDGQMVLATS
jgi:hypothetical protein